MLTTPRVSACWRPRDSDWSETRATGRPITSTGTSGWSGPLAPDRDRPRRAPRPADLVREHLTAGLAGDNHPVRVTGIDHLVLTVASIEAAVDFYSRVLGMDVA